MEIPKAYIPKNYEDKIYQDWEESGLFNPDNLKLPKNAPSYTIILPPPNITAKLHMGQALTLAIEDLFIRYKRMNGFRALWLPGTDHAAIATQNVVEKKLFREEKKTRHDFGREKFLVKVWEFLKETQSTILRQTRKMGASLDWSRQAFTMDAPRVKAVAKMFCDMYEAGVIYRGERVVNWCPRCHSTLADDEVEYQEQSAKIYTFKYDKNFPITIATTRPETKLGDTAVAVNPKDERYRCFIGQEFAVNFVGVPLKIKIINDWQVDMKFGTGALGVTPAHSMVDWQMAKANGLPAVKVIDEDGKIKNGFGKFSGLDVLNARDLVVAKLRSANLLEKEEEMVNNLSICYRCHTPIEPLPSKQWFVAVDKKINRLKNKSLKQAAMAVAEKGKIEFIPERFKKRYLDWLKNMQDWCISRQIWFGHRIPVWYKDAPEIIVMRHGEARNNAIDKLNSDVKKEENGLTEKGIEQVKATAEALVNEKIALIITSDFARTKQTAVIVSERLGVKKIIEDKRLRECGVGGFEGKSDKDFTKFRQTDFETWRNKSPRGIESFGSIRRRVFSALDDIRKKYADKRVLIVTHGDVARVAQAYGKEMNDAEIYKLGFPKTGGFMKVRLGSEEVKAADDSPGADWRQDPDSLDTWFSSGMWTFSTLGWPQNYKNGKKLGDLEKFHPTQMLETGYEIITLWISRMVMMSLFALGEIPFEKVYLHGMVLDKDGKKMSKSRDNGIDPLDMVDAYGADAARVALLIGSTPGNDIRFFEEKVEAGRNLVNKLWNISRFILMAEGNGKGKGQRAKPARNATHSVAGGGKVGESCELTLADRWIITEFNRLKDDVGILLDSYNFSGAGELLRDFTWNKFADWYLEIAKVEGNKDKILHGLLHDLLKLWHPFVPFVTEAIWKEMGENESIMISRWPVVDKKAIDDFAIAEFEIVQQIIIGIRNVRSQYNIPYSKELDVVAAVDKDAALVAANAAVIKQITKLHELKVVVGNLFVKPAGFVSGGVFALGNIFVNVAETVDFGKEKERLEKEKANLANYISGLNKKLGNADFVNNAPADVVEGERTKLAEAEGKLAKVEEQFNNLTI